MKKENKERSWTRCDLDVKPENAVQASVLGDRIRGLSKGYAIFQSFSAISLVRIDSPECAQLMDPEKLLGTSGGRAFDEDQELRWIVEDGEISLWTLQEIKNPSMGSLEKRKKRYYLYGIWKNSVFFESVVRNAKLSYPLDLAPLREDDRACVEVEIYSPAPPRTWPNDPGKVAEILNKPTICAHRLVRLDHGREDE